MPTATLVDEFESHRPHLLSVAYRLTGSVSDAEDAVQESWLRLDDAKAANIRDLRPWLTTVVGRICLDRLRSAATHDRAVRDLVHRLKYRDRTDLAPMMAAWMLRASDGTVESCDTLIPVPLHRTRMLARKFNQAAELARHMARLSGKPLLAATLIRVKRTSQQVGLGAKAREDNVRSAFAIAKGCENDIFGKRIVLVDDVYTTGATVAAASRTLRKAGAADITVLTFARALSEPI